VLLLLSKPLRYIGGGQKCNDDDVLLVQLSCHEVLLREGLRQHEDAHDGQAVYELPRHEFVHMSSFDVPDVLRRLHEAMRCLLLRQRHEDDEMHDVQLRHGRMQVHVYEDDALLHDLLRDRWNVHVPRQDDEDVKFANRLI